MRKARAGVWESRFLTEGREGPGITGPGSHWRDRSPLSSALQCLSRFLVFGDSVSSPTFACPCITLAMCGVYESAPRVHCNPGIPPSGPVRQVPPHSRALPPWKLRTGLMHLPKLPAWEVVLRARRGSLQPLCSTLPPERQNFQSGALRPPSGPLGEVEPQTPGKLFPHTLLHSQVGPSPPKPVGLIGGNASHCRAPGRQGACHKCGGGRAPPCKPAQESCP